MQITRVSFVAVWLVVLVLAPLAGRPSLANAEVSGRHLQVPGLAQGVLESYAPTPATTPFAEGPVSGPGSVISAENASLVAELGHIGRGSVNDIAVSPDGKFFVVTSSLGIWLYESDTFALVRHLETGDSAGTVVFSPRGEVLASASADLQVRIWRASDGTLLRTLEAYADRAGSLAFSPDGTILVTAEFYERGPIKLWQVDDGTLLRVLDGAGNLVFSPDGTTLAIAGLEKGDPIRLWRVDDGALLHVIDLPAVSAGLLAFRPDGQVLVSGASDGVIRLWHVIDGTLLRAIDCEVDGISALAFSPDGATMAWAGAKNLPLHTWSSSDMLIHLWRTSDWTPVRTTELSPSGVSKLGFSPDGKLLAADGWFGTSQIARVSDGSLVRSISADRLRFAPDGKHIFSVDWYNQVHLWQVDDGKLVRTLEGHSDTMFAAGLTPDGETLVSASDNGAVQVWRISDGATLRTIEAHPRTLEPPALGSMALSPDGQIVATSSFYGSGFELWRVSDGTSIRLITESESVESLAFSPDGAILATGVRGGGTHLWRVADGTLVRTLAYQGLSYAVAFSPDGAILASSSSADVLIWDAATGTLLRTLQGHTRAVDGVAFSPDGTLLASSSAYDETVRIWQVKDGALLRTIEEGAQVTAFSPDGTLLAAGEHLWRVSDGAPLAAIAGSHPTFSRDGTKIVTLTGDTIQLWGLLTAESQCLEGVELYYSGDRAAAEPLLEAGYSNRLGAGFEDPTVLGVCAIAIGNVLHRRGDASGAIEAYAVALEVLRGIGDTGSAAAALVNMADVYREQGKYTQALESLEEGLAGFRESGDQVGEARALGALGTLSHSVGRHGDGLQYFEQALSMTRAEGDRSYEAVMLNNIATTYLDRGQHADALLYYQQTLAILGEAGDQSGESRALQGRTLNNIAGVFHHQGRYEEALDYYGQALVIKREVGDRAGEGRTLGNIGGLYHDQAQSSEALSYYQQALAIHQEVGSLSSRATALSNMGDMYRDLGRYDEALESLEQALALSRELGAKAVEGLVLNNLGRVYQDLGRDQDALETYRQALLIDQELGDLTSEAITLNNMGMAQHSLGQDAEALALYERAMDRFESVRSAAGSEEARASYIAQFSSTYARAADLYHSQGQEELAFYTSERARARAFLDSLAAGHVELSDDEANDLLVREQEAYAARAVAKEALDDARADASPDHVLIADLEGQMARAEQDHVDALAAINARHDQLAALVPGRDAVLDLSGVQASLDDQTTLVSYFLTGPTSLAFVITRTSFQVVELPARPAEILQAVLDFHTMGATNLDNLHPRSLVDLHAWLVEPLLPMLTTPHLAIVPHLTLHYLPFAALSDGASYLGERLTLSVLPAASALPGLQANAQLIPSRGALILGDPATGDPSLRPLTHAAPEARAVAQQLGAPSYTGPDASEARLRSGLDGIGIIHLAAHGSFSLVNPLYSAIHLAPGRDFDGRLEAHEVYGLDLATTDLVVLSACQSAWGKQSMGDELMGLTRAFFFAGSPTVISSLWSVDDAATGALMERFYENLANGLSKADALRQAQACIRTDPLHPAWSHPYFWAAFVLSGDPGLPTLSPMAQSTPLSTATPQPAAGSRGESRTVQWLVLVAVLIVGGVAVAGIWMNRRRARRRK